VGQKNQEKKEAKTAWIGQLLGFMLARSDQKEALYHLEDEEKVRSPREVVGERLCFAMVLWKSGSLAV